MIVPPVKSELYAYQSGGKFQVKDHVQGRAPDGSRNVIHGVWINFTGTCTVATAALQGEDVARIFGLIQFHEKGGVLRVNAYGDQLRAFNFQLLGPEKVIEHGDVAVGAAQAISAWIYVPLAKPYEYRPKAYATGADEFLMMEVTMPTASDLSLGTSVVSAIAGNYYVVYDVHPEHSVEAKLKDCISFVAFTTTDQCRVPLKGKPRDLIIHQRGAEGGTALTAMTSVRLDEYGMTPLARADLLVKYTVERGIAPGLSSTQGAELRSDPFRVGRAVPVLICTKDSNAKGRTMDLLTIQATGIASATNLYAVVRETLPQTDEYLASLSARFKTGGWRMKTDGKTKRDPRTWSSAERKYIEKVAPLPGVQRGL